MNYITTRETLETDVRSPGQISRYALIRDELNPGSLNGDSPRFRCTLACLVESFPIAQKISHKKTHQIISKINLTKPFFYYNREQRSLR